MPMRIDFDTMTEEQTFAVAVEALGQLTDLRRREAVMQALDGDEQDELVAHIEQERDTAEAERRAGAR